MFYCTSNRPELRPFLFTKCLREIVNYWRLNGIRIIMFLDDGWGTNVDLSSASADALFVKDSLVKAGFVINDQKSIWLPVQNLLWIGIMWNSIQYEISIPGRRISDCLNTIQFVLENKSHVSARQLAMRSGKLISMKPVYGNLVRLMTGTCIY